MIDNKTIGQARGTDIIAFLKHHCGFTFIQRGIVYRCQQHPSLAVKNDRLSWYWHSKGIGGFGVLDYLIKVEKMPFREAVGAAAGIPPAVTARPWQAEQPKTLMLPEKAGAQLRLYDYLCKKRGINRDIVHTLIQEGRIYEDRRGNVVFVGYDEHNRPRFASVRGTYKQVYRMDCAGSDKRYGFNMAPCAPSGRLYVFESPIDAMSHASLKVAEMGDRAAWEHDRRLSLGGLSDTALSFFLNQHKSVKELVFCLDNDTAGLEAAAGLAKKYAVIGFSTWIEPPYNKDYNLDLLDSYIEPSQLRKWERGRRYER